MVGFRQTVNLSYDQGGNGSELLCDDDVGSGAILVRTMYTSPFPCVHKLWVLVIGAINQSISK